MISTYNFIIDNNVLDAKEDKMPGIFEKIVYTSISLSGIIILAIKPKGKKTKIKPKSNIPNNVRDIMSALFILNVICIIQKAS
jgi:hypothetical protein